jgi:uncharacterized surface protein with fasciclin (FAS1) repeats
MKHQQRRSFLKTSFGLSAVAASSGLLMACGGSDDPVSGPTQNIVQLAQATPDLSILVEAVVKANLAATLSGTGPFTVFAPTNAAFAAALTELNATKDELLNSPDLAKVLTYHVLGAQVLKAQVPVGQNITTVQGDTFVVDASLTITDLLNRTSKIITTDILATNGVVHLIDKVILPAVPAITRAVT